MQSAIVTGGNSGIGRAIAARLTANGMRVAISGRDVERLESTAADLCLAGWAAADGRDREQVAAAAAALVERLDGLDVLVHCAGAHGTAITADAPTAESHAAWEEALAANLTAAYLWTTTAAPHLGDGGRIVVLSTIAAYTGGSQPGGLGYAAAKAGVLGLMRSLDTELAPRGIAVNAIAPGYVADTAFFGDDAEGAAARARRIVARVPAGRPGRPDDVAAAASFLASPGAGYVCGEVLHVNGGWHHGG
jgi:3-oxoacyl-[acyl-carrier protein] reductase